MPHDHIGWPTSMPFTSINPTNPRTNPWNFWKKILRIGEIEKLSCFELAILEFKKKCFIPMKISHKLCDRMDGTQFWFFLWFPVNSLLCVILCYTVYIFATIWLTFFQPSFHVWLFCIFDHELFKFKVFSTEFFSKAVNSSINFSIDTNILCSSENTKLWQSFYIEVVPRGGAPF